MVTRSPRRSTVAIGRWCGIAEFGPGGDDGLERRADRAVAAHPVLQLERDLTLGAAGAQPAGGEQVGQRRVGGRAGRVQRGHLGRVLDRAQPLDQPRRPVQGDALDRRGELPVRVHRDVVGLEAQRPHPASAAATASARALRRSIRTGRSGTSSAAWVR